MTRVALVDILNKSLRAKGFTVRIPSAPQKAKGNIPLPLLGGAIPANASVQSAILGLLQGMGCDNTSVLPDLVGVAKSLLPNVTVDDEKAEYLISQLNEIRATNEALSQEGGVLSASDFAQALGVSRPTIGNYREKGLVLTVPRGTGKQSVYPAWQIRGGKLLPNLGKVLAALDIATPLGKVLFFLTPSSAFDGARPLDVLRGDCKDDIARLIAVADQHVHPR